MARPFLSDSEHKLRGTEAHSSTGAGESRIATALRLKWGQLPKECRATFKRIVRLLADRKHLTDGDREIISMYAVSENRYWKFRDQLDREGWTVHVPDDDDKDHPICKHFYAAERVMIQCLDRLGLNPLARDKAKPTKSNKDDKPADPMEQILSRSGPVVVPFHAPDSEAEEIPEGKEGVQ